MIIGVTGLQAGAYPAPGIEVAKSLASGQFDSAVRLIGIDYDPLCSGLFLKSLFCSTRVIPSLENVDLVIEKLSELITSHGLDILIPNLHCDVELYSILASRLKEMGIKTYLPRPESLSRIHKENFQSLVHGTRLDAPKASVIRSSEELTAFLSECELPVVVKGKTCGAFPARSSDAVRVYAEKVELLFGWPIIIQEFIKGAEYSVMAVADVNSQLRGCAVIKKFGMTDDGQTWSAVTIETSNFLPIVQDLASATQWAGPFEIDLIVEEQTEKTYLVDFNPRFPSWVFVATQAGANLPKLMVELINGAVPRELVIARSGLVCSLTLYDIIGKVEDLIATQIQLQEEIGDVYRRL